MDRFQVLLFFCLYCVAVLALPQPLRSSRIGSVKQVRDRRAEAFKVEERHHRHHPNPLFELGEGPNGLPGSPLFGGSGGTGASGAMNGPSIGVPLGPTGAPGVAGTSGDSGSGSAVPGATVTAGSGSSSAGGASTGAFQLSAILDEEGGGSFLVPITIAGQNLTVLFDTGSSDLWVYDSLLPSSETYNRTVFSVSNSAVQQIPGSSLSASYADGSTISGSLATAPVTAGGVSIPNQAFALPTVANTSSIGDPEWGGVLGMAFPTISQAKPSQQTFLQNIMASLQQPVFTAFLPASGTPIFEFGAIDQTKGTGPITNVPVNNTRGYWGVTLSTFTVGPSPSGGSDQANSTSSTYSFPSSVNGTIIDTGSSSLVMHPAVAQAYYAAVPGSVLQQSPPHPAYLYPCSTQLPDFSVSFGSTYNVTIPGALLANMPFNQTHCFGGIQFVDPHAPQALGVPFLNTQYVVFDAGAQPQLGLSPINAPTNPPPGGPGATQGAPPSSASPPPSTS